MDIQKEWARRPPTESMNTLAALVRDFVARFPRDRRDMVWEFCRSSSGVTQAVQRATMSRNARGTMHNHQSRVPQAVKEAYCNNLLDNYPKQIKRVAYMCANGDGDAAFDQLHDMCEEARVPGVGPVFIYDVATRIGAWCNAHPTSLYLHAGVREGYAALYAGVQGVTYASAYRHLGKVRRVPRDLLLPGLCPPLTADEAEDFLCTYRSVFGDLEGAGV